MRIPQTTRWSAIALILCSLPSAAAQPAPSAADAASAREDKQLAKFVQKQELAFEKAKQLLLSKIDARENLIRDSRELSTDRIRISLKHVAADRKAFEEDDRLPTCDELIGVVIDCLDAFHDVVQPAESYREKMATKAVKSKDDDALARLEKLEKRLAELRLGGDQLKGKSQWKGERHTEKSSMKLHLTIEDREGRHFTGKLVQTGQFGRPSEMHVAGEITGYAIAFETTGMIQGEHRHFIFEGVVVGDRILASLGGSTVKGEPLSGWVSLVNQADVRRTRR